MNFAFHNQSVLHRRTRHSHNWVTSVGMSGVNVVVCTDMGRYSHNVSTATAKIDSEQLITSKEKHAAS